MVLTNAQSKDNDVGQGKERGDQRTRLVTREGKKVPVNKILLEDPQRSFPLSRVSSRESPLLNRPALRARSSIERLVDFHAMSSYNSEAPVLDTYQAVVSAYSDFLTVAIHTILYERNIYPPDSFIKARKYNYPVRQNRHPTVCKWIQDAVAAVEAEMLKVSW